MQIDDFKLGPASNIYLIAEISANHNGSIEIAKKTIQEAKKSGADAVKLQTYTPDTITLNSNEPEFFLSEGLWKGRRLYDLYEEAHTPFEWHRELFECAKQNNITIFSTPFDKTAVNLLEDLNTPAYKIASFEIVDLPLIRRVAATKKPILMSTGAASLQEIEEAVYEAKNSGASDILLFHCTSSYPASIEDANLHFIQKLKEKFDTLVGLSDHTVGTETGFLAAGCGISAIEKHFIIDKNIGGPDSSFSATPSEFRELRKRIDLAKKMLGNQNFDRASSEEQSRNVRKSIYFVNKKRKGEKLKNEDVRVVRPGNGLHPKYLNHLIGETLAADIRFGEATSLKHFNKNLESKILKNRECKFVEFDRTFEHISHLYELLEYRGQNISHKTLPTFTEHKRFVLEHPYKTWWLLFSPTTDELIGSIYIGKDNSVGLNLKFEKISFSATYLFEELGRLVKPNEPRKSIVSNQYFINASPRDFRLKNWLSDSEFYLNQVSFVRK